MSEKKKQRNNIYNDHLTLQSAAVVRISHESLVGGCKLSQCFSQLRLSNTNIWYRTIRWIWRPEVSPLSCGVCVNVQPQ